MIKMKCPHCGAVGFKSIEDSDFNNEESCLYCVCNDCGGTFNVFLMVTDIEKIFD